MYWVRRVENAAEMENVVTVKLNVFFDRFRMLPI